MKITIEFEKYKVEIDDIVGVVLSDGTGAHAQIRPGEIGCGDAQGRSVSMRPGEGFFVNGEKVA